VYLQLTPLNQAPIFLFSPWGARASNAPMR